MSSILIIEDESDLREAMRIRLESEGFKTYFAANAGRGMELAREIGPDLIIMDVILPGEVDGVEITRRLKDDELLKDTPVVMLTVKALEEDKRRAFKIGADAYMTKPFHDEELILTIKSLLGGK